jgi:uncharacterized protein YmfQ (DUF2313 family)
MDKEYTRQLQSFLPHGPAWTRRLGAGLTDLLSALAAMFSWADARIKKLVDESDPMHADETLPECERDFGIPDGAGLDNAIRQSRISVKMSASVSSNNNALAAAAAHLGYDVRIFDFTPAMCGISACGDPLYVPESVFYKSVVYDIGPYDAELQEIIKSMMQSHMNIVFNYNSNGEESGLAE